MLAYRYEPSHVFSPLSFALRLNKQIKGAYEYGVDKLVLPRHLNEEEVNMAVAKGTLTPEEVAIVNFVNDVVELFMETIEGEG